MTKWQLIDFERKLAARFDNGEIPYLTHFSGGNESQLIEIFKEIQPGDYIFTSHRSHYHYLLAGGDPKHLEDMILNGRSMFVFDRKLNFYSSSIVCATPSIAAGAAWALKKNNSPKKVWCFVGDGAEDEGHLYEAVRYVDGWKLPCNFVIEDNDRSVVAHKRERWGLATHIDWPDCVRKYHYVPTWPHGGTGSGKWLEFKKKAEIECVKIQRHSLMSENEYISAEGYKDAVKVSMEMLAGKGAIFVGYNVRHGAAYGTLSDIPESQRLETPVAENLMAGLAMGMTLEGFRPVLFFERHDFTYNALDALVNQADKIETLSDGQYRFPVIIKAVAGSIKPFYAGLTHTSDLTKLFRCAFNFPVLEPMNAEQVIAAYKQAWESTGPILISEKKELY